MSAKTRFVNDEAESYESINIQVKFTGLDVISLKSSEKTLNVRGREFPSSRFGTWIFNDGHQQDDVKEILINGGIVVALIWGMLKTYPEVTAWVTDVNGYCFALDVRKSQKKKMVNEIGCGKMAKQVEKALKNLAVTSFYKNIKVKLFKLMRDASPSKKRTENEKVAIFMNDDNFSWAFMRLKQELQNEKDDVFRLQMLLRLAICSLHLKNANEIESSTDQVLRLMKVVAIPAEQHNEYQHDFLLLHEMLGKTGHFIRAIELAFAFNEVTKKIPESDERIEKIFRNLTRVMRSLTELVSIDPGACLMSQVILYKQQVDKEMEDTKNEKNCSPLLMARNVYYIEFTKTHMESAINKSVALLFGETTKEFNEMVCCWSDYPFVAKKLEQHPLTASYTEDEDFENTCLQISKNPALLKEKISDIRIAQANEVLISEFKGTDEKSKRSAKRAMEEIDIASGIFGSGVTTSKKSGKNNNRPLDKKKEADVEKEKGNDAYKNKLFDKAHKHYDKAIELDPMNAMFHSNKAAVYIEEKKLGQAKSACLTAVRLATQSERHDNRDLSKILARLARIEVLEGKPNGAIETYDRSLRLHHDDKVAQQRQQCIDAIMAMRFMHSMRFGSEFPFY
uniref:uncharacterized protein LOC120336194 isoform X2 n=1 Tax=Styela clava TaxID=7725 RepID=UPI0019394348|nr:uncharacterized protein LOC120336194 isoform X2 [Styela clava]